MMVRRRLPVALGIAPLLVVAACAMTGEPTADSRSSLSGTLAEAKACALRDAYASTPLAGFTSLRRDQLPGGLQAVVPAQVEAIARFAAPPLGNVYLVQDFDDSTTFYDAAASVLARRDPRGTWSIASGTAVSCSSDTTQDDASVRPPSRDADASLCSSTDVPEIEPNDVDPEKIEPAEVVCGNVGGTDIDSFSVRVPADARVWGAGWSTDPDLSTNPPFRVLIDGVPQDKNGLARTDGGTHLIQVSSATGMSITYTLQVAVLQRN